MFDRIETASEDRLEVEAMAIDLCTDAFCELTMSLQAPVPIYSDAPHFGAKGMFWQAGPAFFSDIEMGSFIFSRTQQQIQDFGHTVAIERYRRGVGHGAAEGGPYNMHPGELYVFDMQTRCHSVHLNLHVEDMHLPKTLLGFAPDELVPEVDVPQDTMFGQILFAEWDSLFAALRCDDRYLSDAALDRFVACIKIAMGVPPQREDVRAHARQALFYQICRYIDAQIEHRDVSASHLLRQFGVSRAGLYRMFEPHGGVRNYITTRRAVRAMLDISQNISLRGIVSAAAERWGFSSAPNFNRAIKRVFGATPGAVFKAPTPRQIQVGREASLIESYMASIAA
ncbi:MAG: helix-turn-helix domain-containing protein [Pseudomonadota bacterium]